MYELCSFSEAFLTDLLKTAKVTPAANQIELHAWLPQHDLVKFCHDKGILPQVSAAAQLTASIRLVLTMYCATLGLLSSRFDGFAPAQGRDNYQDCREAQLRSR